VNIRQLEAFRAFMMAGTTKAAAQLIGVSQPAVSRLIDQLETSLAIDLFDRSKGRLIPTPEALLLHDEVERTFVSVDKIREIAADIRMANAGKLTIGVLPAVAFGFVPDAVNRFRKDHPRTSISINIQTSAKVEEWAAAQQIDLGIAEHPFARSGVDADDFCRLPYVLAMPIGHKLSRYTSVRAKDLAGEAFISLTRHTVVRHLVDQIFQKAQIERRLTLEAQFAAVICTLVSQGMGVGLIDPFTAHDFRERVVTRPFLPRLEFHLALLHPNHRPLSKVARAFLATLRTCRNELLAAKGVRPPYADFA
jgi:DNA-binding transcriptional LysR family regulator